MIGSQPVLCVTEINDDAVVGTVGGQILEFKGSNIYRMQQAHAGSCNCLIRSKQAGIIISGGSDGLVKYWNSNLECIKTVDIRKNARVPRIRAICESKDGTKLAVGTRIGNIIVVEGENQQVVHQCHSDNEVWGLYPVPNSPNMVTCGGDFMVALWNTEKRHIEKNIFLKEVGTSCAVSPKGDSLVVGCVTGHLFKISMSTFKVVNSCRDRFKEVSVVRFSPCGKMISAGGNDYLIMIYDASDLMHLNTLSGHKSSLVSMDWSTDSAYIHSNGYRVEDMYWHVDSGERFENGSAELKNVDWHDWSCVYGWPVQGVWTESTYGTEINAVTRSPDKSLLAVGDDYGQLKVYKYPCYSQSAGYFNIIGHASKIGDVYFNSPGNHLFTLGYIDNTMMQWRISKNEGEGATEVLLNEFEEDDLKVFKKNIFSHSKEIADQLKLSSLGGMNNTMLQLQNIEDVDEILAEKPFKLIAEATIPDKEKRKLLNKESPEGNLYLNYCFGYRSFDTRSTLRYVDLSNTIVYPAASLAVSLNIIDRRQRFFDSHTDDVVSLDVSRDRRLCATGSLCSASTATETDYYVWQAATMTEVGRVTGYHGGSVQMLRFSHDYNKIASIGKSSPYTMAIHDWKDDRIICSSIVSADSVYDVDWLDKTHLVTVGKTHVKFWSMKMKSLVCYGGQWREWQAEPLVSARYGKDLCFTGSSTGKIGVWHNCAMQANVQAHESVINCLHFDQATDRLYSGCKAGFVKVWRIEGMSIVEVDTIIKPDTKSLDFRKAIKSIDVSSDGAVLIGRRDATIMTIRGDKREVIMSSHNQGSINAVAVHPIKSVFVTGGGDRTVRMWDVIEKKMAVKKYFKREVTALDWSSDGQLIIAALANCKMYLLSEDLKELAKFESHFYQKKDMRISVAKFCPKEIKDGDRTLVIGATGENRAKLEVINVTKTSELQRLSVLDLTAVGGITHLDWSEDGDIVAINTDAEELKFINVRRGYEINASEAKQVTWHNWTCIYGYPTLGTYPNIIGADVSAVCRSSNRKVIATGDVFQDIKLFRHPSIFAKSGCKYYSAHAATVSDLKFMMADNCLVSIGGSDNAVMVWATDFGDDHPDRDDWLKKQGIAFDM